MLTLRPGTVDDAHSVGLGLNYSCRRVLSLKLSRNNSFLVASITRPPSDQGGSKAYFFKWMMRLVNLAGTLKYQYFFDIGVRGSQCTAGSN